MGISDLNSAASSGLTTGQTLGKVKVTESDVLEYLENKLVGGSNVSLTVVESVDGTQHILINAATSGTSDTYKVKSDSSDASPGFLDGKISDGTAIKILVSGGTLTISFDGGLNDLSDVSTTGMEAGKVLYATSASGSSFASLVLSLLGDVDSSLSLTTDDELIAYNETTEQMEVHTLSQLSDPDNFYQQILLRGNDFAPESLNPSGV